MSHRNSARSKVTTVASVRHDNHVHYDDQEPVEDDCCTGRLQTSIDDVCSARFWRAVIAEFIGTFILVLVSLGSTVQGWNVGVVDPLDVVQIALTFGFSVASSVWIVGHVSGGHINPAVTFAMLATRRISLARALIFIMIQCAGAIAAAGVLKGCTPTSQEGSLGATTLSTDVTVGMGFGVEFFITMFLVLTVFAACDSKRTDLAGSFPLSIGIAVAMGHLWAVEFTGSSMNPARSLGPAVVMNIWTDHWVYWVGPLSGGLVAGLLYDNLLASNASFMKTKYYLVSGSYKNENFPMDVAKVNAIEMDDAKSGRTSKLTNITSHT